jgi:hypothetical protein
MYVTVFCGIDDTKIFKDLHLNYMLGTQALGADHYDREVIRGGLTRNLGRCFPQVRDEMVHAFDYVLALPENGLSYHSGLPYGSFPPRMETCRGLTHRTASRRSYQQPSVCRPPAL